MRTDGYKNNRACGWWFTSFLVFPNFHLFLQLNRITENVFLNTYFKTGYFMAQTLSAEISQTIIFNTMHLCWWGDQTTDTDTRLGSSTWTSQMASKSYPLEPQGSEMFETNTDAFLKFHLDWALDWFPSKIAAQTDCMWFRRSFKITWATCLHRKTCLPAQI